LYANRLRLAIHFEESAHEARKVEDHAGSQGLSRQSSSSASRENGQRILGSISDALRHIGGMSWPHHDDWGDFVQARIAGIEL
jgi:hypothetical protein